MASKKVRANPEPGAALDIETRVTDDHHESVRLWLRLLACTNLIESRIRQRLQSEFDTTLPRFDLMAQLERAPDGLKMGELSRRMMVTGGNVTGIADMLERDGLISREEDPNDRRAYWVKLTREGRKVFAKMAAVHESWIIELFEGLSDADKQLLTRHLGRLKAFILARDNKDVAA